MPVDVPLGSGGNPIWTPIHDVAWQHVESPTDARRPNDNGQVDE